MNSRILIACLLLLLALMASGCAGMSNTQSGAPTMNDCNGDVPSPYPPYCRPEHS
jgi:hypothetical protein